MSIRSGYWTLYAGPYVSASVYDMMEGKTPAEQGLSASTEIMFGTIQASWTTVFTYNLPDPPSGTIAAGTYEVVLRVYGYVGAEQWRVILDGDAGSYQATSDTQTIWAATMAMDLTFTITVGANQTKATWKLIVQQQKPDFPRGNTKIYPTHTNVRFGAKTGYTGTPRSAFSAAPESPPAGTHSSPSLLPTGTPTITLQAAGVYHDDHVTLVKYTDTISTAAHSISGATTQTVGDASAVTTDFPSAGVRRLGVTPDSTRKAGATYNTYWVVTVKDSADGAIGTQAYEVLLDVKTPALLTLNGATSSTYVITDDSLPWVQWADQNTATTHWRVKVYRVSDNAQMWDSTETAAGETLVQIPSGANLVSGVTYYVVVTLMNGSGGSSWSVSSTGYFRLDTTATTVKITSHSGALDNASTITTLTPTVEWSFEREQSAYDLSVVDESDKTTIYTSGWTTSATKSHTIPADELAYGETYSIQVQVKDAIQSHVFSSDERAWVHTNEATVGAPTLTAEADADDVTVVTLDWTAPTILDGDAVTYEVQVEGTTGLATYNASTAATLELGYLPADTYTWRVRATDEHGTVGSWSATDTFVIAASGSTPAVALISRPATIAPLVTAWTWLGDLQTAYQVQLASDAGFVTVVEDSGTVISAEHSYLATVATAGTYYRRVKVRTGTVTWSGWSTTDSTAIVTPTVQTSELEIYLSAGGTPAALDQDTYPASGVSLTYRSNAPAECQFTVHNFDALEGGIDDDEEILLYVRDSDGARVAFRGAVVQKDVGDMLSVTCRDISRLFDNWRVTRHLSWMSLGALIAAIVEDPTGNTPTGITAHCEEVPTETGVVTIQAFDGGAKTVAGWLAAFADATGFFWRVEWIDGAYHFFWYNPASQPTYSVTLKDDVDRADNSASQWCVGDSVRVLKDRTGYANRIVYSGIPDPIPPPLGLDNFDQVFTEAAAGWETFPPLGTPTLVNVGATNTQGYVRRGAYGIVSNYIVDYQGVWPDVIPVCYRRMPANLQDMYRPSFGSVSFRMRLRVVPDGGNPLVSSEDLMNPDLWETVRPNLRPVVYILTTEGAITNVADLNVNAISSVDAGSFCMDKDPAGSWDSWCTYTFPLPWMQFPGSTAQVDEYKHVLAVGFGLRADGYTETVWDYTLRSSPDSNGEINLRMDIDDMCFDPIPVGTSPIDRYVETAAVTAGTEAPIDAPLGVTGLNLSSSRSLAGLMLGYRSRTQTSVQSITIDGIRPIPGRAQVPIAFPRHGIASDTLAVYETRFLPLDSGDRTEVALGDPKLDVAQALAGLRQKLDGLIGGTL